MLVCSGTLSAMLDCSIFIVLYFGGKQCPFPQIDTIEKYESSPIKSE